MHYGLPADNVKLGLVPYHYKGNGLGVFLFPFLPCRASCILPCFEAICGHFVAKVLQIF